MPTNLFFELNSDKKTRIIEVGISEFAKYGYYNSSTNRIVKSSGISKGSLFKYFPSKEDLYLYILDNITMELTKSLDKNISALPKELFERVIMYAEFEFEWYMENSEKYNIVLEAYSKKDSEIYQKIKVRYNLTQQDIYYNLLQNIDETQLKWCKQKTIDVLKWFLKGFNEDFISSIQTNSNIEIDKVKKEYVKSLTEHMEILKYGLIN